jgi:hypothetical protein
MRADQWLASESASRAERFVDECPASRPKASRWRDVVLRELGGSSGKGPPSHFLNSIWPTGRDFEPWIGLHLYRVPRPSPSTGLGHPSEGIPDSRRRSAEPLASGMANRQRSRSSI